MQETIFSVKCGSKLFPQSGVSPQQYQVSFYREAEGGNVLIERRL